LYRLTIIRVDNVFCQYDLASYYFKERSQFFDWNLDSRLCTHLVLGSGVGVDGETGELKITDQHLLLEKSKWDNRSSKYL